MITPHRLYLLGLTVVGLALIAALRADPAWMEPKELKAELVKLGLQVWVIGLAGGALKWLLDRQAEHRAFRENMLERLGDAHREVYRVRRLLSADSANRLTLLGELMNARQALGSAYHVGRIKGLDPKWVQVQTETEAMRDYLEEVINGGLASEDSEQRRKYLDFLRWRDEGSGYEIEFKKRYTDAKQLIDPSFEPSSKKRAPTAR